MNTYQFVWARDTHTFSCHHNTEPTTSTTRAGSRGDSSTGPLKARQRCSLAGRRRGRGRGAAEGGAVSLQPCEWGWEEGVEAGARGGEKETNKPTHPAGEPQPPEATGPTREGRRAPGPAPPCRRGAEPTGAASSGRCSPHPA